VTKPQPEQGSFATKSGSKAVIQPFIANFPERIVSILAIGTPVALKGTSLSPLLSKQEADLLGEHFSGGSLSC
jgi:hypothetical protein